MSSSPEAWGVWRIPETELGVLGDVSGLDVLELGCGAAQWSIALAWCWGTPLLESCWPVDMEAPGTELVRDMFGMHRFVDETDGSIVFMLPHPATIAALGGAGLVVESLLELQPPPDATSTYRPAPEELAWARGWPMEEIWRARKRVA